MLTVYCITVDLIQLFLNNFLINRSNENKTEKQVNDTVIIKVLRLTGNNTPVMCDTLYHTTNKTLHFVMGKYFSHLSSGL